MRYLTLLIVLLASVAVAAPPEQYSELDFYDVEVITPQRRPIKRWQAAENITVITSKQIEMMQAHSVPEALRMVPGLFISSAQDFGSPSTIKIHGSKERHVLVLLDGIEWNYLNDGHAEVGDIPIHIVDRIEVIKGPASAAWGSSLGGVVSIFTKDAGFTERPHGSVSGTAGEQSTSDLWGEVGGRIANFGYYTYGQRQHSDGFERGRGYDSGSMFFKGVCSFGRGSNFTISGGHAEQDISIGDNAAYDIASESDSSVSYLGANFRTAWKGGLSLDLSAYTKEVSPKIQVDSLSSGSLFQSNGYDERLSGASGKAIWKRGHNSMVVGADFKWGSMDQSILSGEALQGYGAPAIIAETSTSNTWALYSNATFVLGNFAITPGLRYDYSDVSDSEVSPSIGLSYRLSKFTVFRATVSKGFSTPPLVSTSTGGVFLDPNPKLRPEQVWSYQAGVESTAVKNIWLSATVFSHKMTDEQERIAGAGGSPLYNDRLENTGDVGRHGVELSFKTSPVNNFSLAGDIAYVKVDLDELSQYREMVVANVGAEYHHPTLANAALFGHYVRWDKTGEWDNDSTLVWDFSLSKRWEFSNGTSLTALCKAHNIFNGREMAENGDTNPRRWIEAGVKLTF